MSADDDSAEKSFDPTPQKLLEARKKGELAKSTDLLTAASYLGLLLALITAGGWSMQRVGVALSVLLDQPASLAPLFFGSAAAGPVGGLMQSVAWGLAPIFALPAIGVLAALFAQRALVFAPSKLQPKMNRISLISNAKNKFGRAGLFEFFKSFVKLLIFSSCLALFIRAWLTEMIGVIQGGHFAAIELMVKICTTFLLVTVLVSGLIGGIDAVWQHFEHIRKNRMSRKDMTDEAKQSEGDPYLKQERRQRAMAASQNQMMQDVPKADVIIVNPTHYAVALQWSREQGSAPVCVAKGVDEIAAAIRRLASEAGVPIHSDPPTARALHATTDIGQEIAHENYAAVAAAIRFAEDMRQRAKGAV